MRDVEAMKALIQPGQPLIVALQTFLNCVQQKTCSGLRYMTGAEARAEAFLALNHGAVGILWYEASAIAKPNTTDTAELEVAHFTPDVWLELCRLGPQLRDLAPLLLSPSPAGQLRSNLPLVTNASSVATGVLDLAAHRNETAMLLVAVNTLQRPVLRAQIDGSELDGFPRSGVMQVYGEGRSVSIVDGVIVDSFLAVEVHVYVYEAAS